MPTIDFDYKQITDPVHGTIGLSKLEVEVLETEALQRLKNVGQLGLVHFVYPGANYSRLSHSIGVCHITGRMLASINRYKRKAGEKEIDDGQIQLYRLAGLLHDVGHYAFSHTTEFACEPYYYPEEITTSSALAGQPDTSGDPRLERDKFINHEKIGAFIVNNCSQVSTILKKHYEPLDISNTFRRLNPNALLYTNLISSDLDADRLDYLARTAHHTGLPYGFTDRDYLLNHIQADKDQNICLSTNAARAAEHFLLSRYFDYRQICYHKSVAGLEIVLQQVIRMLLDKGLLKLGQADVQESILTRAWASHEDSYFLHKIRKLAKTENCALLDCILKRQPPKLVYESAGLEEKQYVADAQAKIKRVFERRVGDWVNKFSISREHFFLWQSQIKLTKAGGESLRRGGAKADAVRQGVMVVDDDGKTELLFEQRDSIMHPLFKSAMRMSRVYVVLPEETPGLRRQIQEAVKGDFGD